MTTLSVIPSYEPSWLAVLGTRRKNKIHSFIICCENFAVFTAYIGFIPMHVQNRSCGRLCHKYPWMYTSLSLYLLGLSRLFLFSFAILTTVVWVFAPSAFAYTTPIAYPPSPQCFESMDVKTERRALYR